MSREHAPRLRVEGLHHLALRVADLSRARAFYEGVLGLAVVSEPTDEEDRPRAAWLRAGDVMLMLELRLRGPG